MSDTADKAIDLVGQWGEAIGRKLTEAAPGAQEVAIEAVKVKIIGDIMWWMFVVVAAVITMTVFTRVIRGFIASLETSNEGLQIAFFISSLASGIIGVVLTIGVILNVPTREIAGIYAPRGYVALMMFDAVSDKSKR